MCFTQYKIISDYISLIFAFYNFGVGGVIAIFYGVWIPCLSRILCSGSPKSLSKCIWLLFRWLLAICCLSSPTYAFHWSRRCLVDDMVSPGLSRRLWYAGCLDSLRTPETLGMSSFWRNLMVLGQWSQESWWSYSWPVIRGGNQWRIDVCIILCGHGPSSDTDYEEELILHEDEAVNEDVSLIIPSDLV